MSKLTAQPVLLAVEHAEGQPTKKTVDLKGVLLWAWGDVHHPKHPDGKYVVDQSFADKMIHAFHALNDGGQYFPALLVEHEADGRVYGLIIDVYTTDAGIACDMRLPAHIHAMIERGELLYISASFFPKYKHQHTGEELENVLSEASFVSKPHLKNIPPLSDVYAHSETGFYTHQPQDNTMAENKTGAEGVEHMEDQENMQEEVEQMEEEGEDKMQAIEAKLDRILALLEPSVEQMEEEEEEVEQSLQEQVAELKQTLAVKDAQLEVRHALPEADDATVGQLAQLKLANPSLYNSTLAIHQSQAPAPPVIDQPIGGGEGNEPLTLEQAEAMAEEAVGSLMSAKVEWFEKNQPQLTKRYLGLE